MKPGVTHQRVEALKVQRQQALARLYYTNERGLQQPRYAHELQAQKVREIEDAYDADLQALMETARTMHDAAEWSRPAVRQAAADRWGVDAQYLPD